MSDNTYNLEWINQPKFVATRMLEYLKSEQFTDVVLFVEGKQIKAHKLLLSACSPYFNSLFALADDKMPIVIVNDASYDDMCALLEYIYSGQTTVEEKRLKIFGELAKNLQVTGLTDLNTDQFLTEEDSKIHDNFELSEDKSSAHSLPNQGSEKSPRRIASGMEYIKNEAEEEENDAKKGNQNYVKEKLTEIANDGSGDKLFLLCDNINDLKFEVESPALSPRLQNKMKAEGDADKYYHKYDDEVRPQVETYENQPSTVILYDFHARTAQNPQESTSEPFKGVAPPSKRHKTISTQTEIDQNIDNRQRTTNKYAKRLFKMLGCSNDAGARLLREDRLSDSHSSELSIKNDITLSGCMSPRCACTSRSTSSCDKKDYKLNAKTSGDSCIDTFSSSRDDTLPESSSRTLTPAESSLKSERSSLINCTKNRRSKSPHISSSLESARTEANRRRTISDKLDAEAIPSSSCSALMSTKRLNNNFNDEKAFSSKRAGTIANQIWSEVVAQAKLNGKLIGTPDSLKELYIQDESALFRCKICQRCFSCLSNFTRHYLSAHKNKIHPCSCPCCFREFNNRQTMKMHMRSVHKMDPTTVFDCVTKSCSQTCRLLTAPIPSIQEEDEDIY